MILEKRRRLEEDIEALTSQTEEKENDGMEEEDEEEKMGGHGEGMDQGEGGTGPIENEVEMSKDDKIEQKDSEDKIDENSDNDNSPKLIDIVQYNSQDIQEDASKDHKETGKGDDGKSGHVVKEQDVTLSSGLRRRTTSGSRWDQREPVHKEAEMETQSAEQDSEGKGSKGDGTKQDSHSPKGDRRGSRGEGKSPRGGEEGATKEELQKKPVTHKDKEEPMEG